MLRRLRDCRNHTAVFDARRECFEPLRVLARQPSKSVRVEPDRGAVDVAEAPLFCQEARHIVLGHPAALDDDLAQPLARLAAFLERLVELDRRDVTTAHEQLPEGCAPRTRRIGYRVCFGVNCHGQPPRMVSTLPLSAAGTDSLSGSFGRFLAPAHRIKMRAIRIKASTATAPNSNMWW